MKKAIGVCLAASLAAATAPAIASAPGGAAYPAHAIHWIQPGAPGSPPDVAARIVAERLARRIGQPVVIENRPGASGTIALAAVARAAPDGYTIGTISMPQMVAPSMMPALPYDTARDLASVTQLAWLSHLLVVRAGVPARNVKELIDYARAHPGQLTFGSPGYGTLPHVAGELFRTRTGVDMRHVPFKSGPFALSALLGGQIDVLFVVPTSVAGQLQAGKLRALATIAPQRIAAYPEVPTMEEAGLPGVQMRDWLGITAPAGTPRAVLERLARETQHILAAAEVRAKLESLGMDAVQGSGPRQLDGLVHSELARWAGVVRMAHLHAD